MILLQNGTLLDGTGAPGRREDVCIDGERFIAPPAVVPPGTETVDCTGLTIAPGFIDTHSHSDVMVLANDTAKSHQGVTAEVVGNCGFSPYPSGESPDAIYQYGRGILAGKERWGWPSAAAYLEHVKQHARLATVFSLVGHGSLRTAHMGARQEAASQKEMDAMEGDLADALDAGACGFSTGLMYAPGSGAPREELIRLLKVVEKRGKIYTTHMRSYAFQLIESTEEQIELARETGCRLQISHFQAVGRANWAKQAPAIELIEKARKDGIDVEWDSYPYLAGSTVLTQLLPQWTLDGGIPAMLARLGDTAMRKQIAEETVAQLAQRWEDIYVSATGSADGAQWVGKHFEQIGEARGLAPVECVFRILEEENGDVNMLCFNQSDDNLRKLLQHPYCTVISDGFYVKGRPHPRLYGTFPCLLGEMARERRWLTLEEAVYRITGKPAARFQMKGRGVIAPGAVADVVVFDPAKIRALATYDNPEQAPEGITSIYRSGSQLLN
ncbi:MAG: D-aminoacylase [Acidobacteria bacterium]|nr:D-aminoacylase [Acidobacteriota bacterium]